MVVLEKVIFSLVSVNLFRRRGGIGRKGGEGVGTRDRRFKNHFWQTNFTKSADFTEFKLEKLDWNLAEEWESIGNYVS